MQIEGIVGPQAATTGAKPGARQGTQGEFVVQDAHGRHYEAAVRGNVYVASTAVAGITHGTAFGTAPPIALLNPSGSGVNLVILKFSASYISGILGAGSYAYGVYAQGAVLAGGTAITPVCALVGSTAVGKAKAASSTGTLGGTPTLIGGSGISFGAFTAATTAISTLTDNIDGAFVIAPGYALAVQGIATAGTAPLLIHALTYEEVPLAT